MSTPKRPVLLPTAPLHRVVKVKRAHPADGLPTLAEARRRLAAWQAKLSPYPTPEALDAARDLPELIGPAIYCKPRRIS